MDLKKNNPQKFSGLSWFAFGACATFCAFALPAYIGLLYLKNPHPNFLFIILSVSVIIASLYQSFYRIKASDRDLKLITSLIVWITVVTILIVIIQNV